MKGTGIRLAHRAARFLAILGCTAACSSTPDQAPPPPPALVVESPAAEPHATPPPPPRAEPEPWRAARREPPKSRLIRAGDDDSGWAAEGLYGTFLLAVSDVLGDFDGNTALFGPTDVVVVPDLDAAGGFGVGISQRWTRWELALVYSMFEHDGEFGGFSNDTDITYLDILIRNYYGVEGPLQPFLTVGVGWSEAEIENGTSNGIIVQDAELGDGINVNVGGGVAMYTLPWLSVYGQGLYRFGRYQTSKGIDGKLDNDPPIDSDAWEISAGVSLRLLPSRR